MIKKSLFELDEFVASIKGEEVATPDYVPYDMKVVSSGTIVVSKGRYYKAGPRIDGQYRDYSPDYWTLNQDLYCNIMGTSFSGTTGSGFLYGKKMNNNWYSVYLVDSNRIALLPIGTVTTVTNSGGFTWLLTQLGTLSGTESLSGFRLGVQHKYPWEPTDNSLYTITQNVRTNSSNYFLTISGYKYGRNTGRWMPGCATSSGSMWTYGGSARVGSSDVFMNDLYRYDFSTNSVIKITVSGGTPPSVERSALSYDPTSNALFQFGGVRWDTNTYYNQTWKCQLYEDDTGYWTQLTPSGSIPGTRLVDSYTFDPVNRRMYIYCGYGSTNSDLCYYSVVNNTWTTVCTSCLPGNKQGASMCYNTASGTLMLYGGGTNMDGPLSTFHEFNINTGSWTSITQPTFAPGGRFWPAAAVRDDYMYLSAGYLNNTSLASDQIWRWHLNNRNWERLSSIPYTVAGHVLVSTPSGLLLSQGHEHYNRADRRAETLLYNPQFDSWSQMVSPEICDGDFISLHPPYNIPSLYLGCIYIESSGTIRPFIKRGWDYTWLHTAGYVINATRGSAFGNTDVTTCLPPHAIECRIGVTTGSTSAASAFRVALAAGDMGTYTWQAFEYPGSLDRRDTVACLEWYNEYNASWQRFAQSINWIMLRHGYIRNRIHQHSVGSLGTPTWGQFVIAGFKE